MSVFEDLLLAAQKIKPVNLNNLKAENLKDPLVLSQIKLQVREDKYTPSEVIEVLEQLIATGYLSSTEYKSANWYNQFLDLVDYFRYGSLLFQKDDEIGRLFKSRLLLAFNEGIDLADLTNTYLLALKDDLIGSKQRNFLLGSMKSNEEKVGDKNIKDWLKEYDAFINKDGERGALEQSTFIIKNNNVSKLPHQHKQRLLEIVKLYDYLRFGRAIPESILLEQGLLRPSKNIKNIKENIIDDKPINNKVVAPIIENKPSVVLSQSPAALKTVAPAFLFDEKDEREIDKFREQMANGKWQMADNLESKLRGLAEEVIQQHNFSFKEEGNKRKFVNLFVSRFKNVRSIVEVRETLLKPVELGGLGLPTDKCEAVIKIVEEEKKKFENLIPKTQDPRPKKSGVIASESRDERGNLTFKEKQREIASSSASLPPRNDGLVSKTKKPMSELDKLIVAESYQVGHMLPVTGEPLELEAGVKISNDQVPISNKFPSSNDKTIIPKTQDPRPNDVKLNTTNIKIENVNVSLESRSSNLEAGIKKDVIPAKEPESRKTSTDVDSRLRGNDKLGSDDKVGSVPVKSSDDDHGASQQNSAISEDGMKKWREEMLGEISKIAPPVEEVAKKVQSVEELEKQDEVKPEIINSKVVDSRLRGNDKQGVIASHSESSEEGRGNLKSKQEQREIASSASLPRNDNVRTGEFAHLTQPMGDLRPKVADVKAPPRVMGPLDELRSLSLIDLRRLAPQTKEALEKLKAKFELLSEHSIAKKLEAVRAWQASAVYKKYLDLGRESIITGLSVAQVIAVQQARGEEALTEDEFNELADFNSRIRF